MNANLSKVAAMALAFVPCACSAGADQENVGPGEPAKLWAGPSGEVYPTEAQRDEALAEPQSVLPSTEINARPATLLATVRLSPTHQAEFYELEPGVQFAVERLHVDRDLEGQPLLFPPQAAADPKAGKQPPLSDMYRTLVGDKTDPKLLDVLAAADRRAASASTSASVSVERGSPVEQDLSALYVRHGALVEKSHASCPGPSDWDWNSDSIWWFDLQGCYNPFSCTNNCWRYNCMATSPATYLEDPSGGGYRTVQTYVTAGFAQQFCNTVRFEMWRQEGSHYLVHYNVFSAVLEPRHYIGTSLGTTKTPLLQMKSYVQKLSGNAPDKKAIAVRWWHPDFWD